LRGRVVRSAEVLKLRGGHIARGNEARLVPSIQNNKSGMFNSSYLDI
jgi:hypothetical protein